MDSVMNYDLFVDRLWNRSVLFLRGMIINTFSYDLSEIIMCRECERYLGRESSYLHEHWLSL